MKNEFGLNQTLRIIGLPKNNWYYHQKRKVSDEVKYQSVKDNLLAIVKEHSVYGYRRAAVELRETYGCLVNRKVILRLMKDQELQLLRRARKPKTNIVVKTLTQLGDKMNLAAMKLIKGEAIGLFEVCYTDFTELKYGQGKKKAQLIPIVECLTRIVIGWALGNTANTKTALAAWEMAAKTIKRLGFSTKGLIIHHDRDPVFTGYEWLGQVMLIDQARVSYALRGAKDNPGMESFNGHLKEESRSLFWECRTIPELSMIVKEQILYYNTKRRHSSLGYLAPLAYLKKRQEQRRF